MGLQELFEEYFQDELDHKNFKPSNIHIIAITSITGSLKTGKTIGEIIKEITKDLKERAPGIGKTRFGIELFDYIKQNWEPPEEWGTAPRAISKQREVTAPTTLLNFEAPIKKGAAPKTKGVAPPTTKHVFKWKLCAPLLQLLIDTGGLPRALERLLDGDLQEIA
ncbi:unnamed protein product [Rhizophagus irregularis]|nr:unnamed protein product [Rhizophagus irregularis]